jgi:hypothetical protein
MPAISRCIITGLDLTGLFPEGLVIGVRAKRPKLEPFLAIRQKT